MIRRQLLSTAGRAAFGAAMLDVNRAKDIAAKVMTGKIVDRPRTVSDLGYEPQSIEDEALNFLRRSRDDILNAKRRMRTYKRLDPDIEALTSCSAVYKRALQLERHVEEEIFDKLVYPDNDSLLSYVGKHIDRLIKET